MKTKPPLSNLSRRLTLPLALALFFVASLTVSVWVFSSGAQTRAESLDKNENRPRGLRFENERRKEEQLEYVRQHSDPSGKVRADAYRKGIEHVQRMKIAPYIGAKPMGAASPTPTPTK